MGFCLFNNAAIAAEWAIRQGFADRVAIVDFDVHHGNGTQEIFWCRPDVLFISSHQSPHYPGTGALSEVGEGDGEGFTVNFPVPAGRGESFFVPLYRDVVVPLLHQFGPQLILVSAGYDIHQDDPLGGMKMTTGGFGALAALLADAASKLCQGRILFLLEGGYDLKALREGVIATIDATLGRADFRKEAEQPSSPDFPAYLQTAKRYLGRYWKL